MTRQVDERGATDVIAQQQFILDSSLLHLYHTYVVIMSGFFALHSCIPGTWSYEPLLC